jgi:hypothetical protein
MKKTTILLAFSLVITSCTNYSYKKYQDELNDFYKLHIAAVETVQSVKTESEEDKIEKIYNYLIEANNNTDISYDKLFEVLIDTYSKTDFIADSLKNEYIKIRYRNDNAWNIDYEYLSDSEKEQCTKIRIWMQKLDDKLIEKYGTNFFTYGGKSGSKYIIFEFGISSFSSAIKKYYNNFKNTELAMVYELRQTNNDSKIYNVTDDISKESFVVKISDEGYYVTPK